MKQCLPPRCLSNGGSGKVKPVSLWQQRRACSLATGVTSGFTGVTSGFTGVERCTTTHSVHYPKCYRTQIYITSHLLVLNICRDCVNLTEVPEGDWLCDQCFTTPAHLPSGGPPGNSTVRTGNNTVQITYTCSEGGLHCTSLLQHLIGTVGTSHTFGHMYSTYGCTH